MKYLPVIMGFKARIVHSKTSLIGLAAQKSAQLQQLIPVSQFW